MKNKKTKHRALQANLIGHDQPPAHAQEYTAADFVPSPTDDDYPF